MFNPSDRSLMLEELPPLKIKLPLSMFDKFFPLLDDFWSNRVDDEGNPPPIHFWVDYIGSPSIDVDVVDDYDENKLYFTVPAIFGHSHEYIDKHNEDLVSMSIKEAERNNAVIPTSGDRHILNGIYNNLAPVENNALDRIKLIYQHYGKTMGTDRTDSPQQDEKQAYDTMFTGYEDVD